MDNLTKALLVAGGALALGIVTQKTMQPEQQQVENQVTDRIIDPEPTQDVQWQVPETERMPAHRNEEENEIYVPAPVLVTPPPTDIPPVEFHAIDPNYRVQIPSDDYNIPGVFSVRVATFDRQDLPLGASEQQIKDAPKTDSRNVVVRDPTKNNVVLWCEFRTGRLSKYENYTIVVTPIRVSDNQPVGSSVALRIPSAASNGFDWWNWYDVYAWFSSDGFEMQQDSLFALKVEISDGNGSQSNSMLYFSGRIGG